MTCKAIGMTVESPTYNLSKDFKECTTKIEATSWFLSNCICTWCIISGQLYIENVRCNYDFDEDDENFQFVHSENLNYEKAYIKDFWDTDERKAIDWESIEFLMQEKIFPPAYGIGNPQKVIFINGKFTEIKQS